MFNCFFRTSCRHLVAADVPWLLWCHNYASNHSRYAFVPVVQLRGYAIVPYCLKGERCPPSLWHRDIDPILLQWNSDQKWTSALTVAKHVFAASVNFHVRDCKVPRFGIPRDEAWQGINESNVLLCNLRFLYSPHLVHSVRFIVETLRKVHIFYDRLHWVQNVWFGWNVKTITAVLRKNAGVGGRRCDVSM